MRARRSWGRREWQYVLPVVVFLTLFQIFPFAYTGYLSLHHWYLPSGSGPRFAGLGNFIRALHDRDLLHSLDVLFRFSAGTLMLEFSLGLLIALLLNQDLSGRNLFRTLFIIPMMATPAAMTLVWKVMYNPTTGVINQLLAPLYAGVGVEPLAWAGSSRTALLSVVLVSAWRWTPFVMLILLAGLQAIPRSLYEAAGVDGATSWQQLVYITLPRMRTAFVTAFLFRSLDVLKTFDEVLVLTRGGPGRATEVTSLYVYFQGFEAFQMGYSSALAMVLFGLSVALVWATMRLSRNDLV